MLIISDEETVAGGREGSFSGSREPEEETDVAGISLADVAAGVEWEMSFFGHKVVHDGEDSLFHLAGVLAAEDHHLPLLKVEADCHISSHVRDVLVGHELSGVENVVICAIGEVLLEFRGGRPDEHVGHEESVVGTSAHDSDSDAVLRAPSCVPINNIDLPSGVQVAFRQPCQDLERFSSDRSVYVPPGNLTLTDGVIDDGLGSGRSTN